MLPVVTLEDAGRLLGSIILTRRMVVSTRAELYVCMLEALEITIEIDVTIVSWYGLG